MQLMQLANFLKKFPSLAAESFAVSSTNIPFNNKYNVKGAFAKDISTYIIKKKKEGRDRDMLQ